MLTASFAPVHIILRLPCGEQKKHNSPRMKTTVRLFLALLCLAPITPTSRGVSPAADGSYPNGNTVEEDNALLDLSTDTENAAMGPAANNPNHRVIPFNFETRCGCDVVILQGELHITFGHREFFGVRQFGPVGLKLQKFRGTAKTTGRMYEAQRLKIAGPVKEKKPLNGLGVGEFTLQFLVTGDPNKPPKADPCPTRKIRLELRRTLIYDFSKGEVTRLNSGKFNVDCLRR